MRHTNKRKLVFLIMLLYMTLPAAAQTYTHTFTCDTSCTVAELNISSTNCTTTCVLELVNVSEFYNASEINDTLAQYALNSSVDSALGDYHTAIEMDMRFAVVEHNLTQMRGDVNDTVAGRLDGYDANISAAMQRFEDILDWKIDSLKDTFVTAEEVNASIDEKTEWVPGYVASETDIFDRMGIYAVIGLGVVAASVTAFYRYKPLRKLLAVKAKSEVRSTESMLTDDDLKKRRGRMIELKKLLIKAKKLKTEQKLALSRKIDSREIYDEESLKDEMDIIIKLGG